MKPVWNIILFMTILMLMGIAILMSANNGSIVGDIIKDSKIANVIEKNVDEIFTLTPY